MRIKHGATLIPAGRVTALLGFIITAFLLLISPSAGAENDPGAGYDLKKLNESPGPDLHKKGCFQDSCLSFFNAELAFDVIFNTKDVFLGGRYEQPLMMKENAELDLGFFFYGRPFEKSSFEQTGPTTYNQYKEYRYITGARLTQKFRFGDSFGVFGGAGYGYTFGSFRGTERPTRDHWTPHYFGGAILSFGRMVNLTGGYQYTEIPHSPDHFIFTSISFNFYLLFALAETGPDTKHSGGDSSSGKKPKSE